MNSGLIDELMNAIPLTIGIVLLVWSGWYVYRAVVRPRGLRGGAACGACGYAITPPIPARCPECGRELAEVGLATAALAARLRGGTIRVVLAWLLFCLFVGVLARGLVASLLMEILPRTYSVTFSESYMIVPTGRQAIGPLQFSVRGSTLRREGEKHPGKCSITMDIRRPFSGVPDGDPTPIQEIVWRSFSWEPQGNRRAELFSGGKRIKETPSLTEQDAAELLVRIDPRFSGEVLAEHAKALSHIAERIVLSPETPHEDVNRAFSDAGLGSVDAIGGVVRSSNASSARIPLVGVVSAESMAWVPTGLLMLIGAVWVARRHRRLTSPMRTKIPA